MIISSVFNNSVLAFYLKRMGGEMNRGWDWWLVRHGESISNRIESQLRSHKRQNPPHWAENLPPDFVPLTENGLWEAWRAAAYVLNCLKSAIVNYDVFSSSFLRVRQTAERISALLHTPPLYIDRNLDEIKLPPSTARSGDFRHWLGNIFNAHKRQLILVGSGNNLRVVMSILLNCPIDTIPSLSSGSISRLVRTDESSWEIFKEGDYPIINFVPPQSKTEDDRL